MVDRPTRSVQEIREALERLEEEREHSDADRQYTQQRERLEQELLEVERAEVLQSYQSLRASIEADIDRQDRLRARIDEALELALDEAES